MSMRTFTLRAAPLKCAVWRCKLKLFSFSLPQGDEGIENGGQLDPSESFQGNSATFRDRVVTRIWAPPTLPSTPKPLKAPKPNMSHVRANAESLASLRRSETARGNQEVIQEEDLQSDLLFVAPL